MKADIAVSSTEPRQVRSIAPAGAATEETAAPASWANDLTPITKADWNYSRAAHLLERAGFGGTPEEVQHLASMTPEQAVNYLVDYESIDASRLPEFEESGIYPQGHKYVSIQKVIEDARATGKALGVCNK